MPEMTCQNVVNMVVEIPKHTHAKMETAIKTPHNPIVQDTKNGKLRFLKNVFPMYGYPFNYGMIPQTFESKNHMVLDKFYSDLTEEEKKITGDQDPVDIIDIGSKPITMGSIVQVKVLGSLPMIDEGEFDCKVIAINIEDPMACELNTVDDVTSKMPAVLDAVYNYYKYYKLPTVNRFLRDREFLNADSTVKLIGEMHEAYKKDFADQVKTFADGQQLKYPFEYKTLACEEQAVYLHHS